MSEGNTEKTFTSVDEIRKQKDVEISSTFPWMTGIEKQINVDTRTLESIDSSQVTKEMAVNLLTLNEKYWREKANQDLADSKGRDDMSFDIWSKYFDALNGTTGKGSVSATIDFFRDRASLQRKNYNDINKELNGESPILKSEDMSLFEHIRKIGENMPLRAKAAENYDTFARLFENSPNIQVVEVKTP